VVVLGLLNSFGEEFLQLLTLFSVTTGGLEVSVDDLDEGGVVLQDDV
jgi:hypothetical protein